MKYALILLIVMAIPFAYAEECHADYVVEYLPGMTKSGDELPADRMNPDNSLQMPENDDTLNFVSLGFGGHIILDMGSNVIVNSEGDDISVSETSYGNPACVEYPETIQVYASNDMQEWTDLGTGCLDSSFEMGSLSTARYIKLVDITVADGFIPEADGYDVDGITASMCRKSEVPEFGMTAGLFAAVGALGGFLILRRKS